MAFGCVCLSHVSGWARCSLQFHLECLPFCRVGSGDTLSYDRTLERRQVASSRLQVAAASCAHGSCFGGREPMAWVPNAADRKSMFLVLQHERTLLLAAVTGLDTFKPHASSATKMRPSTVQSASAAKNLIFASETSSSTKPVGCTTRDQRWPAPILITTPKQCFPVVVGRCDTWCATLSKTNNKPSTGKGHSQIPWNKDRSFQAGVWCNRARSQVLHRECITFRESVSRSAPWPTARTP